MHVPEKKIKTFLPTKIVWCRIFKTLSTDQEIFSYPSTSEGSHQATGKRKSARTHLQDFTQFMVLIEIVGTGQHAGYEAMLFVNATLHQLIDTQSDKQTAAFCVHTRACNPI